MAHIGTKITEWDTRKQTKSPKHTRHIRVLLLSIHKYHCSRVPASLVYTGVHPGYRTAPRFDPRF